MKNVTNWQNSKANLARNLKTLFTLPKWLKIFLSVLSVVLIAGVASVYVLNFFTKDKIYSAEMTLHEQKIAKNNEGKEIGEFNYTARVHFPSLAPLLRSKTISKVYIVKFSWNEGLNSKEFTRLSNSGRNVFFSFTQDLGALGLENLGVVEYRVDFYPLLWSLLRYFVLIVFFAVGGCIFWNSFNIYPFQTTPTPINRKDCIFLGFSFLLCVGICAFTFWLGFPGYNHIIDIGMALGLDKSNWHPVFTPYVLEVLYFLFGKHTYYLFLFNIIPFYLGLFLLIASFYLRFKNPFFILLIFPTFLGEIYFSNFVAFSNSAIAMLLFCLYSLLLFLILVPLDTTFYKRILSKILWISLFILMFITILWRHNAIFSVFPAFFIVIYIALKDRKLSFKTFTKYYILFILLSAVLCLSIVIGVPKILTKKVSYPANLIFLHQIAGTCVPADDSSCFKDEWYREGKTFKDAKIAYQQEPLLADYLVWHPGEIFKDQNITKKELQNAWINSIFKHPLNYIKHQVRMIKAMWIQKGGVAIFDANDMQNTLNNGMGASTAIKIIKNNNFPINEQNITFTPQRERIYSFLYKYRIGSLPCVLGIGVGFVLMIVCGVLLSVYKFRVKFNNTLLLFVFSVSFASFWSGFFIAFFTGNTSSRYMSPILPLSLIAFMGFIAFLLDYLSHKKNKSE